MDERSLDKQLGLEKIMHSLKLEVISPTFDDILYFRSLLLILHKAEN